MEFNRLGAGASASASARLGQSPLIPTSPSSGHRRSPELRAAQVAADAADVVLALQAPLQGQKPGPRFMVIQEAMQRDLELKDMTQSVPTNRRCSEVRIGQVKQLSPFDLAVQRARAQLPLNWNKRPRPLGLAVSEVKAAHALLILNQYAQLLSLLEEDCEASEA